MSTKSLARPQRWLILPDIHLPREDRHSMAALEDYMADHLWDGWVQLGDLIDFDEISRWNEGSARTKREGAMSKAFDYAGRFLDRHAKILRHGPRGNKDCRMVLLEGNHEYRVVDWLDKNPEVAGMVELPAALRLAERGVEWVPYWSEGKLFRLGKCYMAHGRYTGANHAKKHLEVYGVNLIYGHLHSIQAYSMRTLGKNDTREASCIGCLCRYDQPYLRGAPVDWQIGFVVMHVWPNGYFQKFQVRVFHGKFISPEGRSYGG